MHVFILQVIMISKSDVSYIKGKALVNNQIGVNLQISIIIILKKIGGTMPTLTSQFSKQNCVMQLMCIVWFLTSYVKYKVCGTMPKV